MERIPSQINTLAGRNSFFIKRFKVLGIRGIPRVKHSIMKKAVKKQAEAHGIIYLFGEVYLISFTAFFIILFVSLGIPLIPSTLNRFMKKEKHGI